VCCDVVVAAVRVVVSVVPCAIVVVLNYDIPLPHCDVLVLHD